MLVFWYTIPCFLWFWFNQDVYFSMLVGKQKGLMTLWLMINFSQAGGGRPSDQWDQIQSLGYDLKCHKPFRLSSKRIKIAWNAKQGTDRNTGAPFENFYVAILFWLNFYWISCCLCELFWLYASWVSSVLFHRQHKSCVTTIKRSG